jgi:hypothetical protein
MAGDWIKFELTTLDKPEVCQIADLADIDPDAVVGKLMRVWGWLPPLPDHAARNECRAADHRQGAVA